MEDDCQAASVWDYLGDQWIVEYDKDTNKTTWSGHELWQVCGGANGAYINREFLS